MSTQVEDIPESIVVFKFKIQCVIILFITGLVGGLLPIRLKVKDRWLSFGNILSGGFFLAAGFTHMLAESVEGFNRLEIVWFGKELPFAYLLCMFGILLTFFMEKVAMNNHKHSHSPLDLVEVHPENGSHDAERSRGIVKAEGAGVEPQVLNMYVLAILLSVHSIIEGIALGIEDTLVDTTSILIAIAGHKIFDAFALGVSLVKNNVSAANLIKSVSIFAFTTPLGIILGLTLLPNPSESFFTEVVKAISSGTFIYIALVEVILEEFETSKDRFIKFFLLIVGVLVMTILSAHGQHDHGGHAVHT